jgi:hypothetical protein
MTQFQLEGARQARFADCTVIRWAGGVPCSKCGQPIVAGRKAHLVANRLFTVYHPHCCPTHPLVIEKERSTPAENLSFLAADLPGIKIEGPRETSEEIRSRLPKK